MKSVAWILALPFLVGIGLGVVLSPAAAEGGWVLNHCDQSGSFPTTWTREYAQSYASSANGDGYDWAGGCWNGDGVDNTPNQNTYHNEDGEGADCSGFTFKAWAMQNDYGTPRRYWPPLSNKLPDAHGPYTANDFRLGTGAANVLPNKSYATTHLMDAFASTTHIGMIYAELSGGSDSIVEAKDQLVGMTITPQPYRNLDAYKAVKRAVWD